MNKMYISEKEFDLLPPESQRLYYWCRKCERFYLKETTGRCYHI